MHAFLNQPNLVEHIGSMVKSSSNSSNSNSNNTQYNFQDALSVATSTYRVLDFDTSRTPYTVCVDELKRNNNTSQTQQESQAHFRLTPVDKTKMSEKIAVTFSPYPVPAVKVYITNPKGSHGLAVQTSVQSVVLDELPDEWYLIPAAAVFQHNQTLLAAHSSSFNNLFVLMLADDAKGGAGQLQRYAGADGYEQILAGGVTALGAEIISAASSIDLWRLPIPAGGGDLSGDDQWPTAATAGSGGNGGTVDNSSFASTVNIYQTQNHNYADSYGGGARKVTRNNNSNNNHNSQLPPVPTGSPVSHTGSPPPLAGSFGSPTAPPQSIARNGSFNGTRGSFGQFTPVSTPRSAGRRQRLSASVSLSAAALKIRAEAFRRQNQQPNINLNSSDQRLFDANNAKGLAVFPPESAYSTYSAAFSMPRNALKRDDSGTMSRSVSFSPGSPDGIAAPSVPRSAMYAVPDTHFFRQLKDGTDIDDYLENLLKMEQIAADRALSVADDDDLQMLAELKKRGPRANCGFTMVDGTVKVETVAEEGPGAEGGLRPDDIIIGIDGVQTNIMEMLEDLPNRTIGVPIVFQVSREGGETAHCTVIPVIYKTPQQKAAAEAEPEPVKIMSWGMDIDRATVKVIRVHPDGPAAEAGIREGDSVLMLAGFQSSPEVVEEFMTSVTDGHTTDIGVQRHRDGKKKKFSLTPVPLAPPADGVYLSPDAGGAISGVFPSASGLMPSASAGRLSRQGSVAHGGGEGGAVRPSRSQSMAGLPPPSAGGGGLNWGMEMSADMKATGVVEQGYAWNAGIREGDTFMMITGFQATMEVYQDAMKNAKKGDHLEVGVVRASDGKKKKYTLVLGPSKPRAVTMAPQMVSSIVAAPSGEQSPVEPPTKNAAATPVPPPPAEKRRATAPNFGLNIDTNMKAFDVVEGGPAWTAGVRDGDEFMMIGGFEPTVEIATNLLYNAQRDMNVDIGVKTAASGKKKRYSLVPPPSAPAAAPTTGTEGAGGAADPPAPAAEKPRQIPREGRGHVQVSCKEIRS